VPFFFLLQLALKFDEADIPLMEVHQQYPDEEPLQPLQEL
jgi:hypothetical protein